MRTVAFLALLAASSQTFAVSKQDLQLCQTLNNSTKVAQCISSLKDSKRRTQLIDCQKNLQCWSKAHQRSAQYNCDNAFRRSASTSANWRSAWNGQKLRDATWLSRKAATLTYFHDKNGVRLECRYNPRFPDKVKIRYFLTGSN